MYNKLIQKKYYLIFGILFILMPIANPLALAADKPNILMIMSDDVTANNYDTWWIERLYALVPAQTFVAEYIETFKEFPPRQKPAKFNVEEALSTLKSASGTN